MTSAWRQVQGPSKAGPPVFLGPGTKVARNQMVPPDTAQRLLHHQIQRPFAVPAAGLPQHHQVGVSDRATPFCHQYYQKHQILYIKENLFKLSCSDTESLRETLT